MSEVRQDDPAESPGLALRRVVQATQGANLALARHLGLGVSDVAALDHLLASGPLGPAELGDRLGLRSASATALVDRLEAAGHVERHRHPSDRRRLAIVPTAHARTETLTALQPLLQGIGAAAEELGPAERRAVVAYLDRVTAALEAYRESMA